MPLPSAATALDFGPGAASPPIKTTTTTTPRRQPRTGGGLAVVTRLWSRCSKSSHQDYHYNNSKKTAKDRGRACCGHSTSVQVQQVLPSRLSLQQLQEDSQGQGEGLLWSLDFGPGAASPPIKTTTTTTPRRQPRTGGGLAVVTRLRSRCSKSSHQDYHYNNSKKTAKDRGRACCGHLTSVQVQQVLPSRLPLQQLQEDSQGQGEGLLWSLDFGPGAASPPIKTTTTTTPRRQPRTGGGLAVVTRLWSRCSKSSHQDYHYNNSKKTAKDRGRACCGHLTSVQVQQVLPSRLPLQQLQEDSQGQGEGLLWSLDFGPGAASPPIKTTTTTTPRRQPRTGGGLAVVT